MKAKPPGIPNERLRHARQRQGWSQDHLADLVGTNAYTVSRWERGVASPSPFYTRCLVAVFGQDADLLGLVGSRPLQRVGQVPLGTPDYLEGVPVLSLCQRAELTLPPRALPGGALVGREVALGQLKDHLLGERGPQKEAVTGLPGVGKTALVLELARDPDIRQRFAGGVLWAGLGKHPRLFDLFARWGQVLSLPRETLAGLTTLVAWSQALHAAIGMRPMLLVLDDAWQIEDALACQVAGPACRYVLTTRFPALALQFAETAPTVLGELQEDEGLDLLGRLAPSVVETEPEQARRLVQLVGGLPLALTLMGKHLRQHAYPGQPRRLRDALERLCAQQERLHLALPQGPLEAHPSLQPETPLSLAASIGLSAAALSREAREMLRAFGLFPPKPTSFSEEAALAVGAGAPATLDELVDSGLAESAGPGRYRLHQTIADYAQGQDIPRDARLRLVTWAVDWIETHQEDAGLAQELPVLLEAMHQASAQGLQTLLIRGSIRLAPLLLGRGFYTTAEALLHQGQEAASALEQTNELIAILFYLGTIAEKRGDYVRAETLLHTGLRLARTLGEAAHLSSVLMELGVLRSLQGDLQEAQAYLEEGLRCAREAQHDTATQAQILVHLGSLLADRGQLEAAACRYQEACQLAEAAEQPRALCGALEGLASVAARQGQYAQGVSYAEAALALTRQHGYRERLCGVLTNLGVLALDLGQFEDAEGYFGESLQWARELGHRGGSCRALLNLGEVRLRLGRLAEAEETLEEALTMARQLDHLHYRCHGSRLLGQLQLQQGHLQQAEDQLQEGIALARQTTYSWVLCALLCGWGDLQLARQHWEAAQAAFAEAGELARTILSQELEAVARFGGARLAAARGDLARACQEGEASRQLSAALGLYQATEVQRWLTTLPLQEK